jgi:hypothetical protein
MISNKLKYSLIGMRGYIKGKRPEQFLKQYLAFKKKRINSFENRNYVAEIKANREEVLDFIRSLDAEKKTVLGAIEAKKQPKLLAGMDVAFLTMGNNFIPKNVPIMLIDTETGVIFKLYDEARDRERVEKLFNQYIES